MFEPSCLYSQVLTKVFSFPMMKYVQNRQTNDGFTFCACCVQIEIN